jgi:ferredoxin
MNKDKGAVSMKACKASCIGCGKCAKECQFEAITVAGNLSYIDPEKCRLCRKCEKVCPTHAIVAVNFPAPKPKPDTPAETSYTGQPGPSSERKEETV